MKTISLLFLLISSFVTAKGSTFSLPAAPDGTSLHIEKLPFSQPTQLNDTRYEGEGIITVRLISPGTSNGQNPRISLPLRFEPGQIGDIPTAWNRKSSFVAFIMPCHTPGEDRKNQLFVFQVANQNLRAVALPDLAIYLTRIRSDIAYVSLEYHDSGCFTWIGEDLLLVEFIGGTMLNEDIEVGEGREISGHILFQIDAEGNAIIREIAQLRVQG